MINKLWERMIKSYPFPFFYFIRENFMETQISLKDFTIGNINLDKTQLKYLT
jgi:hypothetical protein